MNCHDSTSTVKFVFMRKAALKNMVLATHYWSGKPKTESHLSGVGFMIKNSIVSKLENLLTGHSDHIIFLCLPLHNKQHVLFSVYDPTLQVGPVEKDKFYTDLHHLTQKVPADDNTIILGDLKPE
ncbi:hypothetical protein WISP_30595 [Willisornis vidua]|uniref:Uncharacterized protein n=1 Tax=Willisornis vidua TaxID=1566151 RepID=A0ABQ9DKA4_9PASS|nr:hypothetical protein WISP_30595 [Willisornis vidua]